MGKGNMGMKKMIAFFALVMLIGNLSGCVSNNENNIIGKNNNKNQNNTSIVLT
jgi:hypothetical protein